MPRLCDSKSPTRTRILVAVVIGVFVSLLLSAACRQVKSHAWSADVDSKNLKQTVVVATLACPLPEHKNAIWCSTFQMAWDKLKQDIIGEPIQIPEAQELADRLNRSQFPTGSIEEESYYAVAGPVSNGIIERVQREMRQRFPSEPPPSFDSRYKTLPDVLLAYAYVNVDVRFRYPYYTRLSAFDFQSSTGEKTGVTAFSAQTSARGKNHEQLRDQVEILYYEDSHSSHGEQFAVDLCKQTQPYQVVLARMPRSDTFGDAVKVLQEKSAAFKNDPDYEALRKLRPIDGVVVPDVFFKLTHHFDGLLDKPLGNRKWPDTVIFEAMQKIDFTLSRTGVVVRSWSFMKASTSMGLRRLEFDRPFLICVQKREPNATPFFLMWVDNAELMQEYQSREGR